MIKPFFRSLLPAGLMLLAAFAQGAESPDPRPAAISRLASMGVKQVVFAVRTAGRDGGHWYANFGYYGWSDKATLYGERGRLCILNLQTGELQTLLEDLGGSIRDPQVSYDGRRILFSYRKASTPNYLLHEINIDGTGLRQITFGIYDDIEPTYVADGGIIFVSSRSRRWVNCYPTPVATLFRTDLQGRNIRMLSANLEQDNHPWPMPDGRILYTRWEYVDRSQMTYHHLWTMNPDGSAQKIYYGNYFPGNVYCDAMPVPGTHQVVGSVGGGHGGREHHGSIELFREDLGPDDPKGRQKLGSGSDFRDPYPLSLDCLLVCRNNELHLMDGQGKTTLLYTFQDATKDLTLQEPRPLMPRPLEKLSVSNLDLTQTTGTILIQNVNDGRRMEGIAPGEVTKMLILENLPKPHNRTNSPNPITVSSSFQLDRIIGEVPVAADGSVYAKVPANRSLQLVLLDSQNRSVKRMQSFFTVMPGETLSCVGCHELRGQAPASPAALRLQALSHEASVPQRPGHVPETFRYTRDIQPILDRHCISCHSPANRQGGVTLTGDRGPIWSQSYYELTVRGQFFCGGNLSKSSYPPRRIGDQVSPLLWKMTGAPRDVRLEEAFTGKLEIFPRLVPTDSTAHQGIKLSPAELDLVRYWIHTGAAYPDTYAALGDAGGIGWCDGQGYRDNISKVPAVAKATEVMTQACAGCHTGSEALPRHAADSLGIKSFGPGYSGWDEKIYRSKPVAIFSRHRLYNLTHPKDSLLLRAPLARSAGGEERCRKEGRPVFAGVEDPQYQLLLKGIEATQEALDARGHFDQDHFVPDASWLREMTRYGVLPVDFKPDPASFDPRAVEKAYFEGLWYRPGLKNQWGPEGPG